MAIYTKLLTRSTNILLFITCSLTTTKVNPLSGVPTGGLRPEPPNRIRSQCYLRSIGSALWEGYGTRNRQAYVILERIVVKINLCI
jgi:hypothetical protein